MTVAVPVVWSFGRVLAGSHCGGVLFCGAPARWRPSRNTLTKRAINCESHLADRDELKQHIVVVLSLRPYWLLTVAADFVVREIIWGALLNGDTVLFIPTK